MAYTSKYGFLYKRHLNPSTETPSTLEVPLANSAGPLTVGDTVKWSSGYLAGAGANAAKLGILIGFVDKNGRNIFEQGVSVSGTKSGDDTYTAASNNQTVDMVRGVVVVDKEALFFAYSDSTLSQAGVGLWFAANVADGTYADSVTGTGTAYSAGTYDFQLVELVTTLDDGTASTTTGLFRISRSQLGNDVTA